MRVPKEIHWPEVPAGFEPKGIVRAVGIILDVLRSMRKTLALRDQKVAQAINAADIQVVSEVPTEPPEAGEPCIRVWSFPSMDNYALYVYVNGGWRYVALT